MSEIRRLLYDALQTKDDRRKVRIFLTALRDYRRLSPMSEHDYNTYIASALIIVSSGKSMFNPVISYDEMETVAANLGVFRRGTYATDILNLLGAYSVEWAMAHNRDTFIDRDHKSVVLSDLMRLSYIADKKYIREHVRAEESAGRVIRDLGVFVAGLYTDTELERIFATEEAVRIGRLYRSVLKQNLQLDDLTGTVRRISEFIKD